MTMPRFTDRSWLWFRREWRIFRRAHILMQAWLAVALIYFVLVMLDAVNVPVGFILERLP